MIHEFLHPTTETDTIREIVMLAIGLLIRYFEKRKLKNKKRHLQSEY